VRVELGKAARTKVETDYSLQAAAPRMLSLIREAAGS
jgi:hypothetical protein